MRDTTTTMKIDQTGNKSRNSTQELVLIIAISIVALIVISSGIVFCVYYLKHLKSTKQGRISQFMNGADAIPDNVDKNRVNVNKEFVKNKDGNREIEITNESQESYKDEGIHDNDNGVNQDERVTHEGEHNKYHLEGMRVRIESEYNDNIQDERQKGLFENIDEFQQKVATTKGITNTTATDGSDDPGFV